jgi:hypothetical protein
MLASENSARQIENVLGESSIEFPEQNLAHDLVWIHITD